MRNKDAKQAIFENSGLIVMGTILYSVLSLNIWVLSSGKPESNLCALGLYSPKGSVYTRGYWAKVKPGTRLSTSKLAQIGGLKYYKLR